MNLIDEAFEKAKETLKMNITPMGFTACSRKHDEDPNSNYSSVWTRDSSMTLLWILSLDDSELIECGRKSLETILDAQLSDGHLPGYVSITEGTPRFRGIGNISAIDGPMWVVSAFNNYVKIKNDIVFQKKYYPNIYRVMKWLNSHDTNNCGLLEIPEAGDWMDLFPRYYIVLYDEVLWYRANIDFVEIRKRKNKPYRQFIKRADLIKRCINQQFWPTTDTIRDSMESFADTQFSLGRARYLISQITPFGFNWRCDVFANIIAYLYGVLDQKRAESLWYFLRQINVDQPYPIKILYPAIEPGAGDWREYFLVNLLNLPNHYHNGGIWPFVGGLWVQFLLKLGKRQNAIEALEKLAALCREGIRFEWEFNEWAHGITGKPMGKPYQTWSAASYVAAYVAFQQGITTNKII